LAVNVPGGSHTTDNPYGGHDGAAYDQSFSLCVPTGAANGEEYHECDSDALAQHAYLSFVWGTAGADAGADVG